LVGVDGGRAGSPTKDDERARDELRGRNRRLVVLCYAHVHG
jgi:hypothetical protein